MLSQFTPEGNNACLSELNFNFPKDVYPVGRLDSDSEGILLLTNDKKINSLLLLPSNKHKRTYLVQCEGTLTIEAVRKIEAGVEINVNGKKYFTQPCEAEIILEPDYLPERNPPIRFRKNIPTSWLKITLTEGKNRQVRKMTASVGFPALRLVRIAIENLSLNALVSGNVEILSVEDTYKRLKIKQ